MSEKIPQNIDPETPKALNSEDNFEALDGEIILNDMALEGKIFDLEDNLQDKQKIEQVDQAKNLNEPLLSVEDINTIIEPAKPKLNPILASVSVIKGYIKPVLGLVSLVFAAYLVLTAPAQLAKLEYFFDNFGKQSIVEASYIENNLSFSQAISSALKQGKFNVPKSQELKKLKTKPAGLSDNRLVIPKTKVVAPIIWNSGTDEKAMLASLQKGVAHYSFTSTPNATSGNVFITGHSSNYWWDKGKYNTVFALLDKLKPGDRAYIQYENKIYIYKVAKSVTVRPSNLTIANETKKPTLSLMTCTPVGTSLNRLVVQFDLVGVYTA